MTLSQQEVNTYRQDGLVLGIMPATSFYNHNNGKIKEDAGSPHGYSNRALFLLRGEDTPDEMTLTADTSS